MTRLILTILVLTILFSCSDNNSKAELNKINDTIQIQPSIKIKSADIIHKKSFKNIHDIITDKRSYAWVNRNAKDSSSSVAIHFNLNMVDTVAIAYSAECWLMFPFKASQDEIIVYWDVNIDSKYDFGIVKVINKIETPLRKPFMKLKLINDTTLEASYLIPGLVEKLNSASKDRILFPEKFVAYNTVF